MTDRLQRLQRGLELALNQEWPQLEKTCRHAARLATMPIAPAKRDRSLDRRRRMWPLAS